MNTYAIRSTLIGSLGVALALASGSALAISFRITSLGPLSGTSKHDIVDLGVARSTRHREQGEG